MPETKLIQPDIEGLLKDYSSKVSSSKKERAKKAVKKQDWSDFDQLMKDLGNDSGKEIPDRKVNNEIKSRILGKTVMTDSQHRYIIALFTNELNWTAHSAFRFILKVIPQLRSRLKKRILKESDIQGLYQELNKSEASKLINILKSISERRRK
ncbi:MAG: hypothetical protein JNJ56_14010 [Ignavibacteria bacterium]|nr:hypothetical protein [Ignavibacteria bacterium]